MLVDYILKTNFVHFGKAPLNVLQERRAVSSRAVPVDLDVHWIEGMECVSVFNFKMSSVVHVIVKDVLVITYLLWQLFFMCYTSFCF